MTSQNLREFRESGDGQYEYVGIRYVATITIGSVYAPRGARLSAAKVVGVDLAARIVDVEYEPSPNGKRYRRAWIPIGNMVSEFDVPRRPRVEVRAGIGVESRLSALEAAVKELRSANATSAVKPLSLLGLVGR